MHVQFETKFGNMNLSKIKPGLITSILNNILNILIILLAIYSLLIGIFIPIYADEIAVKISTSRIFLDNFDKITLYPQCGNSVKENLLFFNYLPAAIISLIYQNIGLTGLRVAGQLLALCFFAILLRWISDVNITKSLNRFSFLLSISLLGVAPFFFVLSRPDQLLIFITLILILITLGVNKIEEDKINSKIHIIFISLFVILISVIYYIHPKTLFYTPLLVCLAFLIAGNANPTIKIFTIISVLIFAFGAYYSVGFIYDCNEAPKLKKILSQFTIPISLIWNDPRLFAELFWMNISKFPEAIHRHIGFHSSVQSGWLPPLEGVIKGNHFFNKIIYLISTIFIYGAYLMPWIIILFAFKRRVFSPILIVAALVSLGGVANIGIYYNQNFYDMIQHIGMAFIIYVLLYKFFDHFQTKLKFDASIFRVATIPLFIASTLFLHQNYFERLVKNYSDEVVYVDGQSISIGFSGSGAHIDSLKDLARQCGITEKPIEYLVVDNMSYFAFKDKKYPMHVLYIGGDYFGSDLAGERLGNFLTNLNSPGIISHCDFVPQQFRSSMIRNSYNYCCVNLR